jgi:hypothetical protein
MAYVHKPNQTKNRLQLKSSKCIFVGYGHDSKNYHLLNVVIQKFIISYDIVFNKGALHPNHDTNIVNKNTKPVL